MAISKEVLTRILMVFLVLAENDRELFHPKDIQMVQSNDWWIERFFIDNRTKEEAKNAFIKAFEWRKTFGVQDLKEDDYKDIKDSGRSHFS